MHDQIAANIARVERLIKKAADGKPLPTLVAVSKTQTGETLAAAYDAGLWSFGENRVQEAVEKFTALKAVHTDITLHLIGPLQTNKAKQAVALFDVIETLDRLEIIDAVAAEIKKQNTNPICFLQVNTGDEPQKAGCKIDEIGKLLTHARNVGVTITGLMCIPPVIEPPALHFALLKKLAEQHGLKNLSMGMSGDFERAIKLGATHIRIGTALFGARSKP
jgi:PLP dependent protein